MCDWVLKCHLIANKFIKEGYVADTCSEITQI